MKLSGNFQPNVFFDFGHGAVYANRFAQAFMEFPFFHAEGENARYYVYAEDDDGNLYNTGFAWPRCAACFDTKGASCMKVDTNVLIGVDEDGVFDYSYNIPDYEDILSLKNSGINIAEKEPSGSYLDSWMYVCQSIVFMPQVRPLKKGGKTYCGVDKVSEGDKFCVAALGKGNPVYICSDRRMFMSQSYWYLNSNGKYDFSEGYYHPDEDTAYINDKGESIENVDDYSCKFLINGEFVSTLLLAPGTICTFEAVVDVFPINGVDTEVIYWVADSHAKWYEMKETGRVEWETLDFGYQTVYLPPKVYSTEKYSDDSYRVYYVDERDDSIAFEDRIIEFSE